jgi:hypothetical protein
VKVISSLHMYHRAKGIWLKAVAVVKAEKMD